MAKKKKQTVGYRYFASGHFVLCHGPIDAITKISFQDKDAYQVEESANKTITINKPGLFGGDEQQGGIQGNIQLLFGRANQKKNGALQRICARISNSYGGLISAYRGVFSVVFDNMYIGTSPSMPDSKWRVKRIHTRHDGQVQWYDSKAEIGTVSAADINPAHIIRECLTDSIWGIGVSDLSVDNTSFESAADTLHREGMGISVKWSDSTSINEFVDNIKEHINAQLYLDRVTNKWKLYLIREDYDVSSLISLDESNIRNLDFERRTLAECVNAVTVTYYDRERAKDSTVTVQDIARIAQQGGVVSQSIDYRGFTNSDIASRIALRDLKTLSSTLASVSFDVDESFSESWHEGMAFKVSDESYGLSNAVMRVRSIKRGDGINNIVHVEAIEDSFGSQMQSVVEYVPPITSADSTALDAKAIAFEVPYIELVEQYGQDVIDAKFLNYPELGYAAMAAIRPNNQHINANLYVDAGAGYDERTTLDFCPSATLKTEISYIDSSFEIQNVAEFGLLEINHRLQIDNELVAFVSLDAITNTLTVKRGCFDTLPQKHEAGVTIFGWDDYSGIDDAEYLNGEILSLKALTLTGSDALELNEATEHTLEMVGRAIRPYPPSNVKINAEYYPAEIVGDLTVTWVDRNRIQQTGGAPLGFFDNGISVEEGVIYNAEIYDAQSDVKFTEQLALTSNIATFEKDDLSPQLTRIDLYAIRDGFESYQRYQHVFAWGEPPETFIAAFTENGSFTVPQNISSVDVLIIGGGGGGGSRQGGGGGGGGVVVLSNHTVMPGDSIPVVVGQGGLGGINGGRGLNGENSSFESIEAIGGGGGGGRTTDNNGGIGGSGGGGGATNNVGRSAGGIGTQGGNGGAGETQTIDSVNFIGGGGGGGSGSFGSDFKIISGEAFAGIGGDGLYFQLLTTYGDSGWFGGGGGGAKNFSGVNTQAGGQGGLGGGGRSGYPLNDSASAALPESGQANTGGGGGGAFLSGENGGSGGSGLVIIVYPAGQLEPTIMAKRAITVTL